MAADDTDTALTTPSEGRIPSGKSYNSRSGCRPFLFSASSVLLFSAVASAFSASCQSSAACCLAPAGSVSDESKHAKIREGPQDSA